jgi:hypothetical protein
MIRGPTSQDMKIAILSRPGISFVPVLTSSLVQMLQRLGVEARVFTLGDLALSESFLARMRERPRRIVAAAVRSVSGALLRPLLSEVLTCDAIVFVSSAPKAFLRNCYCAVEGWLRQRAPQVPIILYSAEYHAANNWFTWLARGNPQRNLPAGQWGLERYDWYLCCRAATIFPLPEGENPVTEIGLHLDDGTLRCRQNGAFEALLDFPRDLEGRERAMQRDVLRELGIPYRELRGHHRLSDIRRIYAQTALYFVSCLESFGIPICETQACGNKVVIPSRRWCSAHWQNMRQLRAGVYDGSLPENFVVYDRDRERLKRQLQGLRESYDPQQTRAAFLRDTPQYFYGNLENLRCFLEKLANREITGRSHERWKDLVSSDFHLAENIDFYYYRD